MVGLIFDNINVFKHSSIFDSKANNEELLVLSSNSYDHLVYYAISNSHAIMNAILTQQLIEEDCNLIIAVSEFPSELPDFFNIVSVLETKMPFAPNLVSFNRDALQISLQLDFNQAFYGTLYTAAALDVNLLSLGVARGSPEGYQKLGTVLRSNLNSIIKSQLNLQDNETMQLGYRLLDTFKKVDNQLSTYTRLLGVDNKNVNG